VADASAVGTMSDEVTMSDGYFHDIPSAPAAVAAPLVITVHGTPITQGSKTRNRKSGVRDSNAETLHPWRDNVRSAAREYSSQPDYQRIEGVPVEVGINFYFERPNSHYGTGRNAHLLKDSAPRRPITIKSGDIDKLIRACLDSLTDAGIWKDDAQVADVSASKWYAPGGRAGSLDAPGAVISVSELT
jgi:Holliday junction resolvase RusA-like endonuclease